MLLLRCRRRAPGRDGRCGRVPAIFTTQPSGARLPLQNHQPAASSSADVDRRERPAGPAFRPRSRLLRQIVRPVTVVASPCRSPGLDADACATQSRAAGLCRSVATNRPPGLRSADQRRLATDAVEVVDRKLDSPLRARSRADAARRWSSRPMRRRWRSRSRSPRG